MAWVFLPKIAVLENESFASHDLTSILEHATFGEDQTHKSVPSMQHTHQRAQFMCRQPRQSVQLLPKDVEQKRSYGDCCEIHRGVLSNDQFHGGMLIGIILIWRHFPWMLPLVSEKLWDTKRWAFLSGRNRTIRPWNRKESVRCMKKLKAVRILRSWWESFIYSLSNGSGFNARRMSEIIAWRSTLSFQRWSTSFQCWYHSSSSYRWDLSIPLVNAVGEGFGPLLGFPTLGRAEGLPQKSWKSYRCLEICSIKIRNKHQATRNKIWHRSTSDQGFWMQ